MSNEVEQRICTTAELSDMLDSQSADVDTYTCNCGNQFQAEDVGASTILSKCVLCMEKLKQIIPSKIVVESEVEEDEADNETVVGDKGDAADETDDAADEKDDAADEMDDAADEKDDAADEKDDAADENEFFEEVLGAMTLAVEDRTKTFTFQVNGVVESYKYMFDPVNGSKSRKLFTRMSCPIPLLYGYNCFGAMCVPKNKKKPGQPNVYILPIYGQMLLDIGPVEVLIHTILETRCNRPRYDALVTDIITCETSIVRNIQSVVSKLFPFRSFDAATLER